MPHSLSESDTTTTTPDPLLVVQLTNQVPGVPALYLPSPESDQMARVTDTSNQVPSPGSTPEPPEPYAEQYGVALAAETGNRAALSIIGCYYNQTGHYSTSENS